MVRSLFADTAVPQPVNEQHHFIANQCSLSLINNKTTKYRGVSSTQKFHLFRFHKILLLSIKKHVPRDYWHANLWFITMFTEFPRQFLSWTRQNNATSPHPTLLSSTLKPPSVPTSSKWAFPFRYFPMCRMSLPLHPPSSDRPNTKCDPSPSVTTTTQHPVAKHTQEFCPRRHRPALKTRVSHNSMAHLSATRRTRRSLNIGGGGATDKVWTCIYGKRIKGYSPSNNTFSEKKPKYIKKYHTETNDTSWFVLQLPTYPVTEVEMFQQTNIKSYKC